MTQEQGRNILSQFEEQNILSGKLRENVELIWNAPTYREDNARNLFNLYNAVTQHLTHNVASERFELSNRVSDNVLNMLEKASRQTNVFNKLVQPVALPLEAVALN
jgi:dihydroneopterin aldolase